MVVLGLKKKSPMCKICNSFTDEVLEQITIDLLFGRRSYNEIKRVYNKVLPKGIPLLNDMNLRSHKVHSDPALVANSFLVSNGTFVTDGDVISKLYKERYEAALNKPTILTELYRERLNNIFTLQTMLDDKKTQYRELQAKVTNEQLSPDEKIISQDRLDLLRGHVISITRTIDNMHKSLQEILIKEMNSDKGIGEGSVHITQNFVTIFKGHVEGFLEDIVPYLLVNIFRGDPEKGKDVVAYLTQSLDRHLDTAVNESSLLTGTPLLTAARN